MLLPSGRVRWGCEGHQGFAEGLAGAAAAVADSQTLDEHGLRVNAGRHANGPVSGCNLRVKDSIRSMVPRRATRCTACRLGTWHLGVGGELLCHAALPPQHLAQRHSEAPAHLTQRPECRSSPITALDRAAAARQQHPAAPRPCPVRPWNPPSGPKAHSGSQAQTASDQACCLAGPSAWAHAQPCLQFLTRAQSHAARCPAAPGVHARATFAALMPLMLRAPRCSSSRAHLATSSALLRCVGLNRASAPMRVPAQASHLRTAACSAVRDAGHAVSTCRCATQP